MRRDRGDGSGSWLSWAKGLFGWDSPKHDSKPVLKKSESKRRVLPSVSLEDRAASVTTQTDSLTRAPFSPPAAHWYDEPPQKRTRYMPRTRLELRTPEKNVSRTDLQEFRDSESLQRGRKQFVASLSDTTRRILNNLDSMSSFRTPDSRRNMGRKRSATQGRTPGSVTNFLSMSQQESGESLAKRRRIVSTTTQKDVDNYKEVTSHFMSQRKTDRNREKSKLGGIERAQKVLSSIDSRFSMYSSSGGKRFSLSERTSRWDPKAESVSTKRGVGLKMRDLDTNSNDVVSSVKMKVQKRENEDDSVISVSSKDEDNEQMDNTKELSVEKGSSRLENEPMIKGNDQEECANVVRDDATGIFSNNEPISKVGNAPDGNVSHNSVDRQAEGSEAAPDVAKETEIVETVKDTCNSPESVPAIQDEGGVTSPIITTKRQGEDKEKPELQSERGSVVPSDDPTQEKEGKELLEPHSSLETVNDSKESARSIQGPNDNTAKVGFEISGDDRVLDKTSDVDVGFQFGDSNEEEDNVSTSHGEKVDFRFKKQEDDGKNKTPAFQVGGKKCSEVAFQFGKQVDEGKSKVPAFQFGGDKSSGGDFQFGKQEDNGKDKVSTFQFAGEKSSEVGFQFGKQVDEGKGKAPAFQFGGDKGSKGGFQFGKQVDEGKSEAPAFQFGGDKSSGGVFQFEKQADEGKEKAPAFQFGGDKSSGGDFQFGKQEDNGKDKVSTFQFGGEKSSEVGFQFGKQVDEGKGKAPAFQFGGDKGSKGGFQFGKQVDEGKSEAPAFQFGGDKSSGGVFQFGKPGNEEKSKVSSFATDTDSKPGFEFGKQNSGPFVPGHNTVQTEASDATQVSGDGVEGNKGLPSGVPFSSTKMEAPFQFGKSGGELDSVPSFQFGQPGNGGQSMFQFGVSQQAQNSSLAVQQFGGVQSPITSPFGNQSSSGFGFGVTREQVPFGDTSTTTPSFGNNVVQAGSFQFGGATPQSSGFQFGGSGEGITFPVPVASGGMNEGVGNVPSLNTPSSGMSDYATKKLKKRKRKG